MNEIPKPGSRGPRSGCVGWVTTPSLCKMIDLFLDYAGKKIAEARAAYASGNIRGGGDSRASYQVQRGQHRGLSHPSSWPCGWKISHGRVAANPWGHSWMNWNRPSQLSNLSLR